MESANPTHKNGPNGKELPYLTTFKVCDKTPTKIEVGVGSNTWAEREGSEKPHPVHFLSGYRNNNCTRILQKTDFIKKDQYIGSSPQDNGFVQTIIKCYNDHHNLIIRPDDVWTTIMTQFSFYINKHSEKFRSKFVNFEGQKKLTATMPGALDSAPYDLCVKLMTEEIHKNLVDESVKDWILPNFTTTTENDVITAGIVFMASMKNYFKYGCTLCCGIPFITLDGTLEDWKVIRSRIKTLEEYELIEWAGLLCPIIDQFIEAKDGKPDLTFWNRICSEEGGGSGPTYLSGWITAFCHFDEVGNTIGVPKQWYCESKFPGNTPWNYVDMDKIPHGWVEVDLEIDDNGTKHESVIFAGHFASFLANDKVTLQPASGWAIALKEPQTAQTRLWWMKRIMTQMKSDITSIKEIRIPYRLEQ